MVSLRDQFIPTTEYESVDAFAPLHGCYVYEISGEERSAHVEALRGRSPSVSFLKVEKGAQDTVLLNGGGSIALRKLREVRSFVQGWPDGPVYIDITGMSHEVWAPLIRVAHETGRPVNIVYVEPGAYARSPSAGAVEIFDLRDRIDGIAPLPLFTSLADGDQQACFIALLGFEGPRFALMLNQMEPPSDRIYPIIGVPGFRPEYASYSFLGNAIPLSRSRAHHRVRFARSNCPFAAYYTIDEIASRHTSGLVQLALVGSKPHALGAVLFALKNPDRTELLYDHVRRKPARTVGADHCLVYGVSQFLRT